MTVICEGVETLSESDTLVDLGADLIQGYLRGAASAEIDLTLFSD